MKERLLITIATLAVFAMFSGSMYAQTSGSMTISFTETVSGQTKNVMAVWIENASGTFIKTKMRYVSGGTNDHLPTWAVKSGGTSTNATSTSCNVTDASTGATRTSSTTPTAFGAKTVVWDGKNVSGSSNGTTVPDGVYKVWVESSWNSNLATGAHNDIVSFSFTKGPVADHQTPTGDTYFTGVTIDWTPTASGVTEKKLDDVINIYPNPASEKLIVNVTSEISGQGSISILDMKGRTVYHESFQKLQSGSKTIDISQLAKGNYLFNLNTDNGSTRKKIVVQ